MIVTDDNSKEYLEVIRECKYQRTFPSFSTDTLLVLSTFGVDLNRVPEPACKECIGTGCKNYEARTWRVY